MGLTQRIVQVTGKGNGNWNQKGSKNHINPNILWSMYRFLILFFDVGLVANQNHGVTKCNNFRFF